jgi:cysteine-rich repeat protein
MRWWLAALPVVIVACAHSDPIVSTSSSSGAGGWEYAGAGGWGGETNAVGTGGAGGGRLPVCGDGIVDIGEECDDGNDLMGDGCSDCVIECEPLASKNPDNGHCYRVFSIAVPWKTAEESCQAWGGAPDLGHLVSIADTGEQMFVSGLITDSAWIGGNDIAVEGDYTWTDGTPWMFEQWAPNEPNGSTKENCVFMRTTGDWDDHDCAYMWPSYVCERRGAGTF